MRNNQPFYTLDERRRITIPGNEEETLNYCAEEWIKLADKSIKDHRFFAVALSGGSTPKKIYEKLSKSIKKLDWEKVFLFWSDERSVDPTDPDSNYRMAIEYFEKLDIPKENIIRMAAEKDVDNHAKAYESSIHEKLNGRTFDLIMLGMGDDGHTASLFPHTKALHEDKKLVAGNFIPQKNTWRMTFTYKCINEAQNIHIYVLGKNKAEILHKVLTSPYNPDEYPIQKIGTKERPALWILDEDASQNVLKDLE